MKTEFLTQYGHTWRVFAGLVGDFEPDAWLHTGRGVVTPARLSFHILKSARYYMEDSLPMVFVSGKPFDCDQNALPEADLPAQSDVLACIEELKERTNQWLSGMEFDGENKPFPWAGETRMGVALFTLRHMLYHLGELSSLLNESKNGDAVDNYVKAL